MQYGKVLKFSKIFYIPTSLFILAQCIRQVQHFIQSLCTALLLMICNIFLETPLQSTKKETTKAIALIVNIVQLYVQICYRAVGTRGLKLAWVGPKPTFWLKEIQKFNQWFYKLLLIIALDFQTFLRPCYLGLLEQSVLPEKVVILRNYYCMSEKWTYL